MSACITVYDTLKPKPEYKIWKQQIMASCVVVVYCCVGVCCFVFVDPILGKLRSRCHSSNQGTWVPVHWFTNTPQQHTATTNYASKTKANRCNIMHSHMEIAALFHGGRQDTSFKGLLYWRFKFKFPIIPLLRKSLILTGDNRALSVQIYTYI